MSNKSTEIDVMLGRTDPFEFWMQEANLHAGPLSYISPTEVFSIVQNTFGKTWIEGKVKESEKGSAIDSSRHPLANWILVPGQTQVRSMYELAIYLRQVHAIPRLNEVIRQLEDRESFSNTLIQIAYAYRLIRAGATRVEFEPDVDDGRKADILLEFGGEKYLVECFFPDFANDWYTEIGNVASKRFFKYAMGANKDFLLFSQVKNEPPFDQTIRAEFEKDWRGLVTNVTSNSPLFLEKTNYSLEVRDISQMGPEEREKLFHEYFAKSTSITVQSRMNKHDALSVMRGKGVSREKKDMFFLKVIENESPFDEHIAVLATKMEKKVAQLRRKGNQARGIMVVSSPLVHPRNVMSNEPFQKLQGKVIEAHANVDAAIIVHPTEGQAGDPKFGGFLLTSIRPDTKTGLLNALVDLEAKGPLLEY